MPLQEEVAGFQPSAADLDYPDKLERLAQAHDPAASSTADRGVSREEGEADERAPLASNDAQVCCMKRKQTAACYRQVRSTLSQHITPRGAIAPAEELYAALHRYRVSRAPVLHAA